LRTGRRRLVATSRCAKQEQTPPLELHVTQDLRPRGSPAHHMEGHARHDGREDVYVQLGVDLRAVPAPPPRRALMPDVRGGCGLRAGPHCIAQRGRSAASPRSPSPPAAAAWVPAPGAMPALLVIGTRARPRYSPRPVLVCRTSLRPRGFNVGARSGAQQCCPVERRRLAGLVTLYILLPWGAAGPPRTCELRRAKQAED